MYVKKRASAHPFQL